MTGSQHFKLLWPDCELVVCRNAPDMIRDLADHLASASLISLDHDLLQGDGERHLGASWTRPNRRMELSETLLKLSGRAALGQLIRRPRSVMEMMRYATVVGVSLLVCGCGKAAAPKADSDVLLRVRQITAEELGIRVEQVEPRKTFRSLGADALDIVEVTMETEDQLGITIRDEDLNAIAGDATLETLAEHLTVRAFAEVAGKSEKAKPVSRAQWDGPKDPKVLNKHDVGPYSELSKKPNPHGLVLVFVPALADMLRLAQDNAGRELTADEAETVKQNAVVMALPADQAEVVMRKQK